jgi:hypothetical protein
MRQAREKINGRKQGEARGPDGKRQLGEGMGWRASRVDGRDGTEGRNLKN